MIFKQFWKENRYNLCTSKTKFHLACSHEGAINFLDEVIRSIKVMCTQRQHLRDVTHNGSSRHLVKRAWGNLYH